MTALDLLDELLRENVPGSTVKISLADAKALESLGRRSLGDLWDAVEKFGIVTALEKFGLFARKIEVVRGDAKRAQ